MGKIKNIRWKWLTTQIEMHSVMQLLLLLLSRYVRGTAHSYTIEFKFFTLPAHQSTLLNTFGGTDL